MKVLAVSILYGLHKPKSGGQSRFYNIIIQLIKNKNRLIVLQASKNKDDADAELAKNYYFKEYHISNRTLAILTDVNIYFILKMIKILKDKQIDVIQFSGPWGIIASKFLVKLMRKRITIIYDAHNVESDITEHTFKNNPKYSFLERVFILNYTYLQEKFAVKICDHILSVSHEDKMQFIEKYNIDEKKVTVIPSGVNIINLTTLEDKYEIKKEFGVERNKLVIIFHGAYFHLPNNEAIDLIKNYIAPKVMKINKDILFVIAGFDVPIFEDENVKSIGFVKDLYSLLHAADLAIVPIRGGGGTRLKILDYMGVGLPIVTTKKGIEGLNTKNGEHAIIVDDVNEAFINAIKYLIDNEQERKRIGANARRLAEEEYDWNKIGEKLDKLYKRILKEKKRANK